MLTFSLRTDVPPYVSSLPLPPPSELILVHSPFTYLIEGLVVNAMGGQEITCDPNEFQAVVPPAGQQCVEYLSAYVSSATGYAQVLDDGSCGYCVVGLINARSTSPLANPSLLQYRTGDQFFAGLGMSYSHRWRDVGLMVAYIGFNVVACFALTYLVRLGTLLFLSHLAKSDRYTHSTLLLTGEV